MSPASVDRLLGEIQARIEHLEEEIEKLRQWRHTLPNELLIPIQSEILELKDLLIKRAENPDSGETRIIRVRDIVTCSATVAITIGALKLLGKL